MERGRFDDHHRKILNDIYGLPGFSGDVVNVRNVMPPTESVQVPESAPVPGSPKPPNEEGEAALEDDQNDEDEDIQTLTSFYGLIDMSYDNAA